MEITIGWWLVPTLITLVGLVEMFRPYTSSVDYDIGWALRFLWVVPILLVWVVYLGLVVWLR